MVGIIKEDDMKFENVQYAPTDNVIDYPPSCRIDTDSISHLTVDQQTEFL